jgi:hypothetical protein
MAGTLGLNEAMNTMAPWMIAGQTVSGFFNAYSQISSYKHQLKIKSIQDKLNDRLAEMAFRNNYQQLLEAQSDVREQGEQELLEEQKVFRENQARLKVFQAERGIEGQSAEDLHNDLLRSHHAWKQIRLANLHKAERQMEMQKLSAKNQYLSQKYSSIGGAIEPSAFLGGLSGAFEGFNQSLATYYRFMSWTDTSLDSQPPQGSID